MGVCTSKTATLKSMAKQVEEFKLKPFANMLDAGGATATAYHVPQNAIVWVAVVNAEGKLAFDGTRGWRYQDKRFVHHVQIDESLKKSPGILGIPEVPAGLETAAHYFDLQQFGPLEFELKKAEAKADAAGKEFAGKLRDRMEESRKAWAEQIKAMLKTEPMQAYREAESFMEAFPRAPEKSAVSQVARDAARDPAVKKELQAEQLYQRMLVPEMLKAKTHKAFTQRVQPLLEAYLKKFGDTRYAEVAKASVEEYGKALLMNE